MLKLRYAPPHPKAMAARYAFYRNRENSPHSKCRTSFEQLLVLFADTSLTFSDIRKKIGLAGKGAERLYDTYFCELFGCVTATERHELILAERREQRVEQIMAEFMPTLGWFDAISGGAASIGKAVRPHVTMREDGRMSAVCRGSVFIGDTLCHVHPIVTAQRPKNRCMRNGVKRIPVDTLDRPHLFPVLIPKINLGTFVIPGADLREAHGAPEAGSIRVVIQLKRNGQPYRCRINCWPYLNDWRLLLQ